MYNPQQGSAAYAPPPPSAPPASMFGTVPGYEGTVPGGGGFLPPPVPAEPLPPPQPAPGQDEWSIPTITEDVAREAFLEFASSNCCWSSGPAKDSTITKMEPFNTYRYRLETFTEDRSTEWSHKPHEGEQPDFYTQTAPRPWEIAATPPSLFTNHEADIRVPYTSSIKDCHNCRASGRMPCHECNGMGGKECWVCKGAGRRDDEECGRCNSTGRDSCSHCNGHGTTECDVCKGKMQLLTFINLKVKWTNHVEDFVVEQNSGLNSANLSSVTGKQLFQNNQYMVYPVVGFPDPSISQAADRLVKEHQAKFFQSSRVLQQRQTIELIPISKVSYKWKDSPYSYYVYGNEHQVTADYPATCCCTIL